MKHFPFVSVLTLMFVAAKLFGVINWSWWLVFSPILLGWTIGLTILGVFFVLGIIGELVK